MAIKLDSKLSIYELVNAHPDIQSIMLELGFKDILKPGMLQSAGRIMTLAKGAKMKKIDMDIIKKAFYDSGYELADKEDLHERTN